MRMRMTMVSNRSRRRRWAYAAGSSRAMSMGGRVESILSSRLVALERLLDQADEPSALWHEYYTVVDLWLRCRAPVSTTGPTITKAMLEERLKVTKGNGRQ
jgi:hypothetical protein